jgi:hypothetical protein
MYTAWIGSTACWQGAGLADVHRVDRLHLGGVEFLQQRHQPAHIDVVLDVIQRQPRHARAGYRQLPQRFAVARPHRPGYGQRDHPSIDTQWPIRRIAPVAPAQPVVRLQLLRRVRRAVLGKVIGRGHDRLAGFAEAPRHQV